MPIILLLLLVLCPSVSNAALFSYDDITPIPRTIKIIIKDNKYEERQAKIKEYEDKQIELEIQRLEREERRQVYKATNSLIKEINSLNHLSFYIDKESNIHSDISRLFIKRITRPDTWDKG